MTTVRIQWTEESHHEVYLEVPDDVADNPENYDLENSLAQLANDGFAGLERYGVTVEPAAPPAGSNIETFTPERVD